MLLEHAIIITDPKSVNLLFNSISSRSQLSKSDVMASLGLLQSRQPFGLSLVIAKYTKDKDSYNRSLDSLKKICVEKMPYQIKKSSYKKLNLVIHQLCEILLNDYCRTADTKILACRCKGRGTVNDHVCKRCGGLGIRRLSATKICLVMSRVIEIKRTTWARYWQPFYNDLFALCEQAESLAEQEFKKITK